jgi:trehalose-6-phosphate synthase
MSNTMTGAAQSAAGIVVMSQNSGAASLIQQAVTVQANLTVGH